MSDTTPLLEVRGLKKSFAGASVLKDINFSLEAGEVLSIIGSSGSGKTTLLRCLNFLETPDAGTIAINGTPIFEAGTATKNEAEIRAARLHFGLVFQDFNLFPQYSVLENVTLAPALLGADTPERIQARAEELIERVGLADKRASYPRELSGGQKQRVAIARALALNPDILCFDEPTSALDPELTGEVLKVIRALAARNTTMIVVTHELGFARGVSDALLFMADGVIEEAGTPDELFSNPQSEKLKAFLAHSLERVS